MKVDEIQIIGFEAFLDSGKIGFRDGINVIVGQNNSGKTSILRALQPDLRDHRHRGPGRVGFAQLPPPTVLLRLQIDGAEIREVLYESGQTLFPVPVEGDMEAFLYEALESRHTISLTHQAGRLFSAPYPAHGLFDSTVDAATITAIVSAMNGKLTVSARQVRT